MLHTTLVSSNEELYQVLELQKKNLLDVLSETEREREGFVTLKYSIDALQQMHAVAPSIIAKDGNQVVGYALSLLPSCRDVVPALAPLFTLLDKLSWKDMPVREQSYYVMGQICIDKKYRGLGLFDKLYLQHRETYSNRYNLLITEISSRNHRSLKAHERVGFQDIHVHDEPSDRWQVVGWDWR